MSIATQITALQTDKTDIASAITAKGGTVNTGDGFDDFAADIGTIPSCGDTSTWTRPAYRLPKPIINDNEVVWLYGVRDTTFNWLCFSAATDGTQYKIDWGDGNVETFNNDEVAFHDFSYDALTNITPDADGYKEVWVKLTPVNTNENLKALKLNAKPSWMETKLSCSFISTVLELYIRASQLETIIFCELALHRPCQVYAGYAYCDIFGLYENSLTECIGMCTGFHALKQIDSMNINSIPIIYGFLYDCWQYNKKFPSDLDFSNVSNYFMYNCYSYNQPFPEHATFEKAGSYFMGNCFSYNQPFPDSVIFGNFGECFLDNAWKFSHPVKITVSSDNTNFKALVLARTSCTGIKINNYNPTCKTLEFYNFAKLTREMAVQVFNDVPNMTALSITDATIDINNTIAATQLTNADKFIATNKGWTIIGA